MAHAIKTVLTYNLDGATKDFNIPFEYLARKFVVVTLIGVDRKVLVLNQDYRFSTRTTISTTIAWGSAQGYNQIEIRRYTSATERLVDFTDGSILRAYDLNVAQVQTLHVAEEARDLTADTIGVNNDGHLDARGRRIVNLADAVEDSDALSFGQVKRMNENAWQSRNEALQFRNEAEQFKVGTAEDRNATASDKSITENLKNQTQGFRDEAEQFKNQAAASQGAAAGSAQSAANSQAAAAASQGAAAKSEQDAAASAANANRDAAEALKALESSGSVPVGTIAMITHTNIPPGWVRCGEAFDVNTYPALAKLFPNGITPGFDDRFPMGNSQGAPHVGALGNQTLPEHTHGFNVTVTGVTADAGAYHGGTSQDGNHTHGVPNIPTYEWKQATANGPYQIAMAAASGQTDWGGLHTHAFDIPDHSHQLTAQGSGVTDPTGIGNSPYLRPYHTVVIFIIKAAQGVDEADQAMQVVGTIVGRVDAIETFKSNAEPILRYVGAVTPGASRYEGYRYTITNGDVQKNAWATIWGSDFQGLMKGLKDNGLVPQGATSVVVDFAINFHEFSQGFQFGFYMGTVTGRFVLSATGTNSLDGFGIPVSWFAHALNGNIVKMQVANQSGDSGGNPHLDLYIGDGTNNNPVPFHASYEVMLKPVMVIN